MLGSRRNRDQAGRRPPCCRLHRHSDIPVVAVALFKGPSAARKPAQSCGNAGAVESVESQRQASLSFHEPLGNLAKGGRDSHIPPAPTTRADGKVENPKQVFHFPTASVPIPEPITHAEGGLSPVPRAA